MHHIDDFLMQSKQSIWKEEMKKQQWGHRDYMSSKQIESNDTQSIFFNYITLLAIFLCFYKILSLNQIKYINFKTV